MRLSQYFLPTMREVPSDATVISHQLMLRAGFIRKVSAGIYTFLPLGLRVIKKISRIIEEEMNAASGQEILMPMVQPSELWSESGRLNEYGPELLRFEDRKKTLYCLGPTHEELMTDLVRNHIKSYKQLPLILYQIQTKFRDEIRPRFGLMRGREFIMKDAYSFCISKKDQEAAYQKMWNAYHEIFNRCGLKFRAVKAATGSIGGEMSHEFQVLAQSGEDAIASCSNCNYTANVELAEISSGEKNVDLFDAPTETIEVHTPNVKTIEELSEFLSVKMEQTIKSIAIEADEKFYLVLVQGDHELSEDKLKKALKAKAVTLADEDEVEKKLGPIGFLGPKKLASIKIVADWALNNKKSYVVGANKKDFHLQNFSLSTDLGVEFQDIRMANVGDRCNECGSDFEFLRGIEVGHIFYLGQKYSSAMKAEVQGEDGKLHVLEMGSYGIGVGRTAAAAIEQNHDDSGIIWPKSIAPFDVHLVSMGNDPDVVSCAENIYRDLLGSGLEVLFDDRDERAGVKLNDADLIGCPLRITVGKRGVKNKEIEVLVRKEQKNGPIHLPLDQGLVERVQSIYGSI